MLSLSGRKLKELQQENEELKNILKSIGDKEEKINRLEEVRVKLQYDLKELSEKKSLELNELNKIKDQIKETSKSLQEVRSQIGETHHTNLLNRNPFLSDSETEVVFNSETDSEEIISDEEIEEELTEVQIKKDKLIGENIRLEETARELT
ncbi:MAG TPA: hypothetical protein VH917_01470, partial [Ignavibacteriaceae bacterium]